MKNEKDVFKLKSVLNVKGSIKKNGCFISKLFGKVRAFY